MQESWRHHFVPKFLLRPWLTRDAKNQEVLLGFWWDRRRGSLSRKRRGLDSFCFQIGLLTLTAHRHGRDAIERLFFGEIDDKGATARDILVASGPQRPTAEQRCDWARLLLSLEARRPPAVEKLRKEGSSFLTANLDDDPEIRAAMEEYGISQAPSSYVEQQLGWRLEDRALGIIQRMVDDPAVGGRLINAHWAVRRLGRGDGQLVLSDRPLIRINGYNHPGAVWVLPLAPSAAFIACNHPSNLGILQRLSGQRFVKETNRSSVNQAERFVFSVHDSDARWLSKHMRPPKS